MEKPIPSAIEHEGRLLVLKPHKVLIQSDEGQRYLRERHAAVMKHLDAYPALRKHLFTDKWAEGFQKKWLSDERTLASFCYPSFYFEPFQLEIGIWPKDYLARADAAVAFLVEKAPKANRNDLFGNLLSGVSVAAEFEVMLTWALVTHFGKEAVQPYSRIGTQGKQNVDFAVTGDGARVLIEAMVLLDDSGYGQEKQYAIEHGTGGTYGFRSDEQDAHRLMRACYDKVHQRDLQDPLILCVNQCATWPDPATGTEAVGRLLAREIWARDSMLVGVAYFYSGHLVSTGFAEARVRAIGASAALVSEIRCALSRLASQSAVDAALVESKKADPEDASSA